MQHISCIGCSHINENDSLYVCSNCFQSFSKFLKTIYPHHLDEIKFINNVLYVDDIIESYESVSNKYIIIKFIENKKTYYDSVYIPKFLETRNIDTTFIKSKIFKKIFDYIYGHKYRDVVIKKIELHHL